ncbi:MAG: SEL1-like repeat protein [Sphingobium sp.]
MARSVRILIESRMQDALDGDPGACFDLGIAHSSGPNGAADRVEAYKWFDLAAQGGCRSADACRAELARDMTVRELAEARRRLRLLGMPHAAQVARFSASLFA